MATERIAHRVERMFALLKKEFPTPYPVSLRWVNRIPLGYTEHTTKRDRAVGCYGETQRVGKRIRISLARRVQRNYFIAYQILFHEYAHAVDYRHERVESKREEHHGDEFYLTLGRIERWWERRGWYLINGRTPPE